GRLAAVAHFFQRVFGADRLDLVVVVMGTVYFLQHAAIVVVGHRLGRFRLRYGLGNHIGIYIRRYRAIVVVVRTVFGLRGRVVLIRRFGVQRLRGFGSRFLAVFYSVVAVLMVVAVFAFLGSAGLRSAGFMVMSGPLTALAATAAATP